ncbi:MAG TPA: HDOD domain-containing protein [Burkholderiaceae bacterium]|nr:HDOD domain-containing protein [Burkholderiaceae bacterium]
MSKFPSSIAAAPTNSGTSGSESPLDLLVQRLGDARDFPAFSTAIQQLNRLSRSGDESLAALAAVVLQDVGLTHKMLRAVNSPYYRRSQGTPVTTMSRAIQLLGFDAMRELALSLLHLEQMRNAPNAEVLLQRFIEVCVASEFAREIAGHVAVPAEQASICAAFQDLGWLVVLHNLPADAQRIEKAMQGGALSLAEASRRELGAEVGELGLRLAREWGFADTVLDGMAPLRADRPVRTPRNHAQWLRAGASAAREAARLLLTSGGRTPEQALPPLVERYGRPLNLTLPSLCAAARRAILRVNQLCAALDVTVDRALASRLAALGLPLQEAEHGLSYDLVAGGGVVAGDAVLRTEVVHRAADGDAVRLTEVVGVREPEGAAGAASAPAEGTSHRSGRRAPAHAAVEKDDATARIAAGLAELDAARTRLAGLAEVIRIAMLTLHEALALQRVVLCMRDARRDRLIGRVGIGHRAADVAPDIDVALDRSVDVFSAACIKGTDLLISDADAPSLRARLPGWFLDPAFGARSFLLLPLRGPAMPIGLLYGDHARSGGIRLQEAQLDLLRGLRNRLMDAIRERG